MQQPGSEERRSTSPRPSQQAALAETGPLLPDAAADGSLSEFSEHDTSLAVPVDAIDSLQERSTDQRGANGSPPSRRGKRKGDTSRTVQKRKRPLCDSRRGQVRHTLHLIPQALLK